MGLENNKIPHLKARTLRAQEAIMENEVKEVVEDVKDSTKTYTQEEVDKMVQQEADRRATKAVQTNTERLREQWEKEYQQKLEEEKELAKLSEKERLARGLEDKEKEIKKRERELSKKQLYFEAKQDLLDKGLPADFADFLVGEDAEGTLTNINKFRETFQTEVEKAVDAKLRSTVPRKGETIEKNPFAKGQINLTEQGRLLKENPSLAKKLMAEA